MIAFTIIGHNARIMFLKYNFLRSGNVTGLPGDGESLTLLRLILDFESSTALSLFVSNTRSFIDETLRCLGFRGSTSMFCNHLYVLFLSLLDGGLLLAINSWSTEQGSLRDCGLGMHKQGPLVTLLSPSGFNSASKEYIAAEMCFQPPSLPPLHLQNASSTLPLFAPRPSRINHKE